MKLIFIRWKDEMGRLGSVLRFRGNRRYAALRGSLHSERIGAYRVGFRPQLEDRHCTRRLYHLEPLEQSDDIPQRIVGLRQPGRRD